jgi:orotidine-5'-phosphate decarboxylase
MFSTDADAVWTYNQALIDALADACACFKVQIAFYEALGLAGLAVYARTLAEVRRRGCVVITDIKRGDIGNTADQYATAHLAPGSDFEADLVTLSPFMGMDTLEPWLAAAENYGKGAFVLVKTSNPRWSDFEAPVYHNIGDKLEALAGEHHGSTRFGVLGAVVGCTTADEAAQLRARWPSLFFLVPGYGAQGGAASTARTLVGNNAGVVSSSRAILQAWKKVAPDAASLKQAAEAARNEALAMRAALTPTQGQ